MSDEDQIRDLQALWAQRRSDSDAEGWGELFVENGRYIRPNRQVYEGRAAIVTHIGASNATRPPDRRTAHICGPAIVRIDGAAAESVTEYVAYNRDGAAAEWTITAVGRLHNHLVKQDGRWYFTEVDNTAYFWGTPAPDRLPGLPRL